MITALFVVASGGAMGAVCRYLFSVVIHPGLFPWATFSTNVLGCLAIGALSVSSLTNNNDWFRLFLQVGVLGGFTTFSTFSLETIQLIQEQKFFTGASYVALSIIACFIGVTLGMAVTKTLQTLG